MENYVQIIQIDYMAPLEADTPTHVESVIVIAHTREQMSRYINLVRGREISVTILATDKQDILPMALDLDAIEAKQQHNEQTEPGNDEAAQVH